MNIDDIVEEYLDMPPEEMAKMIAEIRNRKHVIKPAVEKRKRVARKSTMQSLTGKMSKEEIQEAMRLLETKK